MFTSKDINQLAARGISLATAIRQLQYFKTGFPYLHIDRPATVNDGIRRLTDADISRFEGAYDRRPASMRVLKFVPASGAATRMFKDLYEFVATGRQTPAIEDVFAHLDEFAFAEALRKLLPARADERDIARAILEPTGLNYGNLPKGLLLFHRYPDSPRTAFEEHLVEGAAYACNADSAVGTVGTVGTVALHFTVSEAHQAGFEKLLKTKLSRYEEAYSVRFEISFSQQKPSTDTLAVDLHNQPLRTTDGSLLFRPGGHGALLENLNDQAADIIFIKNIDNVVPDRLKPATTVYKKALAGLLIELQGRARDLYRHLKAEADPSPTLLDEAQTFLGEQLSFRFPATFAASSPEARRTGLLDALNRPIRVCGMVENEGEPGGGPFWASNADGSTSLQIAESSQLNLADPAQKAIADAATHFNPVDLVCAVTDADGQPFDLMQFSDPDTGFISVKSKDGVALKAQELPGLWNGAMARWLTVFVEVPIETFNPVKTLNDLLRKQHAG